MNCFTHSISISPTETCERVCKSLLYLFFSISLQTYRENLCEAAFLATIAQNAATKLYSWLELINKWIKSEVLDLPEWIFISTDFTRRKNFSDHQLKFRLNVCFSIFGTNALTEFLINKTAFFFFGWYFITDRNCWNVLDIFFDIFLKIIRIYFYWFPLFAPANFFWSRLSWNRLENSSEPAETGNHTIWLIFVS